MRDRRQSQPAQALPALWNQGTAADVRFFRREPGGSTCRTGPHRAGLLLLLLSLLIRLPCFGQEADVGILGGRVIDPASGLDAQRNLYVRDGRVLAVTDSLMPAARTIDAGGLVVAPGFVDVLAGVPAARGTPALQGDGRGDHRPRHARRPGGRRRLVRRPREGRLPGQLRHHRRARGAAPRRGRHRPVRPGDRAAAARHARSRRRRHRFGRGGNRLRHQLRARVFLRGDPGDVRGRRGQGSARPRALPLQRVGVSRHHRAVAAGGHRRGRGHRGQGPDGAPGLLRGGLDGDLPSR